MIPPEVLIKIVKLLGPVPAGYRIRGFAVARQGISNVLPKWPFQQHCPIMGSFFTPTWILFARHGAFAWIRVHSTEGWEDVRIDLEMLTPTELLLGPDENEGA